VEVLVSLFNPSLVFLGNRRVSCCSCCVSNVDFCKGDGACCEFCPYLAGEWGEWIVAGGVFNTGDEGGMR
jgi:hypothetical protein